MIKLYFLNSFYFLLLLMFPWNNLFAQQTEIKGVVKDSVAATTVEGAVVKAVADGKTVAFAITDKTGKYKLTFENPASQLLINFKHLCFHDKSVKVENKSQLINAVLTFKEVTLREVVVKAPDVIHKKDTVSYSVAAFQGAADRTIEDVIKKMPGVEVAENGMISYQGKGISKFNIEGLDMLGGKYTLATKNIEAKAVNRVEVMENYQEVKQLQGKEYSNKVAMNLKLKKEAKIKLMGTLELGTGYSSEEWLYHAGVNGMAFRPKFQFLGVAKANNLGESLRPEFSNQFGYETASNTANSLLSGDLGSIPPIASKRYWRKDELISSLNTIIKLDSSSRLLKVGVDFLHDKSNYNAIATSNYFLNNQYVTFNEDMKPQYDQKRLGGNVEFNYNSNKLYLTNRTSFGGEVNGNNFSLKSDSGAINQQKNNRLLNLGNRLYAFKRIGKMQYSFSSSLGYSHLPESRLTFLGVKNDLGDFYQTSAGSTFNTNESLSFSHDVGKLSKLGINISFDGTYDDIQTRLQQNGKATLNHNFGYKMTTSISPTYRIESPTQQYSFRLSLPVSMYNLNFKDDRGLADFQFNKPFISPSLSGHYLFTPMLKVEFGGGLSYGIGDISDFILQPIQVSYRQQQTRSGILAQNRSASANMTFIYKNPIHLFFSNGSIGYSQNRRNVIANQQFGGGSTGLDVTSTDVATVNTSQGISTNGYVSKKVRSINTTFSARTNYGFSTGNSLRQGVMTEMKNHSFLVSSDINTEIIKKIFIGYSISYSQNKQLFAQRSETYHQLSNSIDLSYAVTEKLILHSNWDFDRRELTPYNYKNMHFFDCTARYKMKKAEIELKANNLFNLQEYGYTIFSGIDQFSYRYNLRPREIIAMVKWNW